MAILNDLKKLFFGAKAVTKSAAEKTVEAGKETGSEVWEKTKDTVETVGKVVLEKTGQAMDKAADFAENIGSKILQGAEVAKEKMKGTDESDEQEAEEGPVLLVHKEVGEPAKIKDDPSGKDEIMDAILEEQKSASPLQAEKETLELPKLEPDPQAPRQLEAPDEEPSLLDNLKSTASKVGSEVTEKSGKALDKAADLAEGVGKKVLDTGGRMAEKFGEKAEEVGGVIFEKSGEAIERAKHLAEDLGSKFLKAKDDLMQKAQEEAAKSGERTDSLIEQAKNLGQKLEDKLKGKTDFEKDFSQKPLDTGGSELNKHGSFWEKADRYAKGDYHNQGEDRLELDQLKIQQNPDYKPLEKGKVKGLDDKDGDGDELIDDAIIEEDK